MRLLRQPRLALLFAGGALNAIGTWATLIALWGFAAYHFHAHPGQVALLGLAWSLPGAVLSPLAGYPIDRFGPRAVMIASDLLGAATALAMAAAGSYSTLLVLALFTGTVQAFGRPASISLPPRLVDDRDLLAANSLLGVANQSAIVFGPLAGSLAIAWWGIQAAFYFDAATFVVGILAVLPLQLRPIAGGGRQHGPSRRDLLAGWRLARTIPDVRRTLLLAAAVFCSWGAFFVLEPLYVRDVLHRSPATLGLLQTCFGVGLIGMTMLLPRIGDRVATVRVLALAVATSGVTAAVYVGTRSLAVAIAGVFLWGVDVAFFMPPMQTVLQRATPGPAHGRVMALASTVNGAGQMAAIPLTGLVVAALGVQATGAIVGALAVVAGLVGLVVCGREGAARVAEAGSAAPAAAGPVSAGRASAGRVSAGGRARATAASAMAAD
jgi:predicted MFS family arabinose efflux permease